MIRQMLSQLVVAFGIVVITVGAFRSPEPESTIKLATAVILGGIGLVLNELAHWRRL